MGGHYFLSTPMSDPTKSPVADPILNGPILAKCSILRHVMLSVAEAEIAGVFVNAKNAEMIQQILIILGHPQSPTPIKTNNTTATDTNTNTVKQKQNKSDGHAFLLAP